MDTYTPLVTGITTFRTSFSSTERDITDFFFDNSLESSFDFCLNISIFDFVCFDAFLTAFFHETLRHHHFERRCDKKWFDSHIDKTLNRTRGGVGMDRREYEVSGECRLYRECGRLFIADFSYHDNVGILSDEGAKS
jgi:hypothetical protein